MPGARAASTMIVDHEGDEMGEQLLEHGCADYEEDGYLEFVRKCETPSFDADADLEDAVDDGDLLLFPTSLLSLSAAGSWSATNFVIAEDEDDHSFAIETEFVSGQRTVAGRRQRPRVQDVRVKFQDLSKPYLARITNNQNYLKFLHLVKG